MKGSPYKAAPAEDLGGLQKWIAENAGGNEETLVRLRRHLPEAILEELTPRQVEKWLNEQAVLFERDCRHTPQPVQQLTLAKYIDLWLADIAPGKLAKSTIRRDRQDI